MRHAVLGAGGVGGLVGGALAKAGHPVTLLVRPGRRGHYPERLSVQSEPFGNFEAPVRVADRLDEQFDIVWIAVKAMALESALSTVPPEVLGDGVLVPLLNGVDHVRRLRDRYGAERVLPGTIRVEAEQAGLGRVRHLSAFADVQLAPNPPTLVRAQTLCEELRDAGLGCEVQDDETTMLWSKLCFLAPFALATTASEGSLGVVRADAGGWQAWSSALMRPVQSG
jgi:2-dehydropantoate 2-reductase